jgi:prophage antirepressor-like protein
VSEKTDTRIIRQKYANGITMLNEPGLYKVSSGKNEQFEKWIFFEILPTIRKTGKY